MAESSAHHSEGPESENVQGCDPQPSGYSLRPRQRQSRRKARINQKSPQAVIERVRWSAPKCIREMPLAFGEVISAGIVPEICLAIAQGLDFLPWTLA